MKNFFKLQIIIPFVLIIGSLIYFLFPRYQVLTFEYEDSQKLLGYAPVKTGQAFDMKYIHSIHLTPVYESYYVSDHDIIQYQLSYEEYGIGMPSHAEEGETFTEQNGRFIISGMNRVFPQIDIRVAQVTESQMVTLNNKSFYLTSLAEPGTWIRIQVQKLSRWKLLKGENILERT